LTVRLPEDWCRFVKSAAANAAANDPRENCRPDFWVRRFTAEAALKVALDLDDVSGFKIYVSSNCALGLMVPATLVDPIETDLMLVLAEYISAECVVFHGCIKDTAARQRYSPRLVEGRGPLLHVVPLSRLTSLLELCLK